MTVPTVGAGGDPFAEYRAEAMQPKQRELKQEMDKDLFLSLLVASVKYQDPSEPMKTQEMVQQTTALSQMEQFLEMTKVTQAQYQLSQRTAAASMIGTEVTYVVDGQQMKGMVYGVRVAGEDMMVDLGGNEVNVKDIVAVGLPGGAGGSVPQAPHQGVQAPASPATPAPAADAASDATAAPEAAAGSGTAAPAPGTAADETADAPAADAPAADGAAGTDSASDSDGAAPADPITA